MPASQAGSKTCVLALFANGKRELVVGNDDAGVVLLLVNQHAGDLSRGQCVGNVDGGIGIPQNDVHALTAKLTHDSAHAAALGANAGAHGIQAIVQGVDGDLGSLARLAGDGLDLNGALVDLGHLLLEETLDESRVRTGDDDGRTAVLAAHGRHGGVGIAHVDDDGLQALVVQVALTHGALIALVLVAVKVEVRKLGLDALANLDNREVGRGLQHGTGDDIANTARELLVDLLASRIAHDGVDLCLGVLGCDARGVLRGDVNLLETGVIALFVHGVVIGDQLVHVDLAGGAVDGDLRAPIQVKNLSVALSERLLQTIDEVKLIDMPLLAQGHEGFHHLGCCHIYLPPFSFLKSKVGFKVHFFTSSKEMLVCSPSSVSRVTEASSAAAMMPLYRRWPSVAMVESSQRSPMNFWKSEGRRRGRAIPGEETSSV